MLWSWIWTRLFWRRFCFLCLNFFLSKHSSSVPTLLTCYPSFNSNHQISVDFGWITWVYIVLNSFDRRSASGRFVRATKAGSAEDAQSSGAVQEGSRLQNQERRQTSQPTRPTFETNIDLSDDWWRNSVVFSEQYCDPNVVLCPSAAYELGGKSNPFILKRNPESICCMWANMESICCMWANMESICCMWANMESICYMWAYMESICCIWANMKLICCMWANMESICYMWANMESICCMWANSPTWNQSAACGPTWNRSATCGPTWNQSAACGPTWNQFSAYGPTWNQAV